MNAKTKALSEQARQLTPEERIELIEDLQKSLDPTDPEIDRPGPRRPAIGSTPIVEEKSKPLPLRRF